MRKPGFDVSTSVALLLIVAGIGLMVFFDLQTDEPIMDEYARQWAIRRLASGQSLQLWGTNAAMVQILEAAPLAFLQLAPRFWRLPQLLFFTLLPIYVYRMALRFGAQRFWAAVAAAAITCSPLTLGVATGMMNDTVFLGLFMAGAFYLLEWQKGWRPRAILVVLVFLSTLQRDQGIGLAIVLAAAVLWDARQRLPSLTDILWLASAAAAAGMALYIPRYFRAVVRFGGVPNTGAGFGRPVFATAEVAILAGFLLLPLAWGLVRRIDGEAGTRSRLILFPFALGWGALVGAAILKVVTQGTIFPGVWVGPWGLGPTQLLDIRPSVWPTAMFLALEAATCFTFAVLLLWRRAAWLPSRLGRDRTLMVLLAVVELLPILVYSAAYDRFYIQVVAPVTPVVASLIVPTWGRAIPARAWALGSLVFLLGFYAVGEQDYLAWHAARTEAAQLAYRTYSPWEVVGGFEMDAQHVWIPATDRPPGALPGAVVSCPKAYLAWTSQSDPRPGVNYYSAFPGRVVVARSSCP